MRSCAAVLLFALVLATGAGAFTVDCNAEYADCDTELKKEDDTTQPQAQTAQELAITTQPMTPQTESTATDLRSKEKELKYVAFPKPRLLHLLEESLPDPIANKTQEKPKKDLSDVNLDNDDDHSTETNIHEDMHHRKMISDSFFSNLQAPFHSLMSQEETKFEATECKEQNDVYMIGEHIERGCEESCVCMPTGLLECSPRCKHPYIRRGRKLSDPFCFESPVDECCSIVACTAGDNRGETEMCRSENQTYSVGATWKIGCDRTCTCEAGGNVECKPRCKFIPQKENCINVVDPQDSCCEIQVCDVSHDVHEEPPDNLPKNVAEQNTLPMTTMPATTAAMDGTQTFEDILKFTSQGILSPSKVKSQSQQDTSFEENVQVHNFTEGSPMMVSLHMNPISTYNSSIGSIKVLQNNSVQVNLIHMNETSKPVDLMLSSDGGKTFKDIELNYSNLLLNLEGGKDYILKAKETGNNFNFTITASDKDSKKNNEKAKLSESEGCSHGDMLYAVGEEFHIDCSELCECTAPGVKECVPLACPSHVGIELLSKGCVKWATNPPAQPPNCCPRVARCLSDGTCNYHGTPIPNWSEVPIFLTGCEKRCFCENGDLDCQDICSPLPPVPPQTLRCPSGFKPAPVNISEEDCCKQWGCISKEHAAQIADPPSLSHPPFLPTIPPEIHFPDEDRPDYNQNNINRPGVALEVPAPETGLHTPQNYRPENRKLTVITIHADSPTSVKMLFGLPPVLVGLRGSVDLRYTDKGDEDVTKWLSQVFAPADEILSTPRLEFRLTGLNPSTTYKVRGKLYLHNLAVEPESDVYSVRTLDLPTVIPVEEKRREIDTALTVMDSNDTSAHISWRHFSEEELQFVDGIQVRYRPVGTPIYSMTELLHHSRSNAELHDLRPGSRYEASLVLVPPPKATTELHDPGRVEFTTAPYIDPYNWSVAIEARAVGSEAAELTWHGVPSPAERWVRVYRAAHACGGSRKEHDAFRLATRDVPPTLTLTNLEPNMRCRVWLELFLTNGKVKTSNVLEINTKSLNSGDPVDNTIEASSIAGSRTNRSDYYGALVVVGVVAALGALTSLLLLLIVLRRHRPRSVPITPVPNAPRESSLPPYDNPAYKLELQQETVDL